MIDFVIELFGGLVELFLDLVVEIPRRRKRNKKK